MPFIQEIKRFRGRLEALYARYNNRERIVPDPIAFIYRFEDPLDQEIVGLIASSLAYGRVRQIEKSVQSVLEKIPAPRRCLDSASPKNLGTVLSGFRHRFTSGEDVTGLLKGMKRAIEEHGSLEACFRHGYDPGEETFLPALERFVNALGPKRTAGRFSLLPSPEKGSACKRLNLFLRWMVRRDCVDPGVWTGFPPSKLVVPLDTHMHRVCLEMGFTDKKQANRTTALEVTRAFRLVAPDDPVRYDFCLTRPR